MGTYTNGYSIPERNYAFIDGSFNPETRCYGYGGFVVDQYGEKHIIKGDGNDYYMRKMRNVAGEILGAQKAAELAMFLGMDKLIIFYDYDGVENWVTGFWHCKKRETKDYHDIMHSIMDRGLQIVFCHVKGHAGIPENEEADLLAKQAVGLR